jgi:hypothetical protein
MTKVRLSPSVFEYRQAMAELVDQVCDKITIIGVNPERRSEPSPTQNDVPLPPVAGLLTPPRIESLDLDISLSGGQLECLIQITTSDEFGVMNVYVILEDDQGNHIESGYAMPEPYYQDYWWYVTSVPLPSSTSVVVRAIALDPLGGVGIQTTCRHNRPIMGSTQLKTGRRGWILFNS